MAPTVGGQNSVPKGRGRKNDVLREGAEMALQGGRQTCASRGRQNGAPKRVVKWRLQAGAKMWSPWGEPKWPPTEEC